MTPIKPLDLPSHTLDAIDDDIMHGRFGPARARLKWVLAWGNHRMGRVFLEQQDPAKAEAHLREAVQAEPDRPTWLFDLARALRLQNRFDEAIVLYNRALELDPGFLEAHVSRANLLRDLGRYREAARSYSRALMVDPDHFDSLRSYGRLQRILWSFDDAIEALTSAHRLRPEDSQVRRSLAEIRHKQGRFQEAFDWVRPLLERKPIHPEVLSIVAAVGPYLDEDPEVLPLLLERLEGPRVRANWRASLHFAAGNLLEREGIFDAAFDHFTQGNAACSGSYDPGEWTRKVDEILDLADGPPLPRSTTMDDRMIFIVGLPRSGTTMLDQILTTHDEVDGAGELILIGRLIENMVKNTGQPYPACLRHVGTDDLDNYAREYLNFVKSSYGASPRMTDKMNANVWHLPLIAMLFPKARVVHCRRDPMDCGLSCFVTDLRPSNPFSEDLGHIGHHIREVDRLVRHVLPTLPIPVHQVNYESLVDDFEAGVREILAFAGLEFQPACLEFHKNERVVTTSSSVQVRQPLNRQSIGRWRAYARHLDPLKKALGDLGPA